MKQFIKEIAVLILALLKKVISLKVFAFTAGTTLGVIMAKPLGADFIHWAGYQVLLLVIFFTANQYQKWLFGMILRGKDATQLS